MDGTLAGWVAGADVRGAPVAVVDRPVARLLVAVAGLVATELRPLFGDGLAGWVVAPDDAETCGDGVVEVDGTEDPLGVQAETTIVSRTAPAATRPAVSRAFRVAAGVLSRIFMDPPRTRVRCTR